MLAVLTRYCYRRRCGIESGEQEKDESCALFNTNCQCGYLVDRLKDKTDRPLLFSRKPKETLNQLYNQREELYKEARFIVKVDGKSADELAEEILRLVNDDNRIAD